MKDLRFFQFNFYVKKKSAVLKTVLEQCISKDALGADYWSTEIRIDTIDLFDDIAV